MGLSQIWLFSSDVNDIDLIRISLSGIAPVKVWYALTNPSLKKALTVIIPELIIFDLSIGPIQDSLGFCERLKSENEIPIIFISDSLDEESYKRIRSISPVGFVQKPIQEQALLISVDMAITKFDMEINREKLLSKFRLLMTENNMKTTQVITLLNSAELLNSSHDIREIKNVTIEASRLLGYGETANVLFFDDKRNMLYHDYSESGESLIKDVVGLGEGLAGVVAQTQEAVIINDALECSKYKEELGIVETTELKSVVCMPIVANSKILGVIEVINKQSGFFDEEDLEILHALCNQSAIALENAGLYGQLQSTFYDFVDTLSATIDSRDPYTGGHTKRVKEYCLQIGGVLELAQEELDNLELAAMLHDIGKIGVSDSILRKPDRLTDEEYDQMKKHPEIGENILKRIENLQSVIPGIKHHHERFDGKGYPSGIAGDAIDLNSRIIAVADSFDAMTTDRSYRKALSKEVAVKELMDNAGTQFDPFVVSAFLSVL